MLKEDHVKVMPGEPFDVETRKRKAEELKRTNESRKVGAVTPGIGTPTMRSDDMDTSNTANPQTVNPQGQLALPAGNASSKQRAALGGETPITPIPKAIYKPFPDTLNTIHPMRFYIAKDLAQGSSNTSIATFSVRLNSIYDCSYTLPGFAQDPPPAADVPDAGINNPCMRKYWSEFYNYWTVVGTKYKVKMWVTNPDATATPAPAQAECVAYFYFHGQQNPPIQNYGSNTRVEHFARKRHPNMYYKYIRPTDWTKTGANAFSQVVVDEGYFKPGSIANLVAEDEFHETWHRNTEVPSYREILTILWQRSERSADVAMRVWFELELEYEVQWKDLKCQHEYITMDSSIAAISQYAINT